jgi:hypothetical protein
MLVDGDFEEAIQLADPMRRDGEIVPITRPATAAGDLRGSVFAWPVEHYIQAIQVLTQRGEAVKQQIYEITGIHDLQRGATKERESAAAQRMKGAFGNVRMTPRSAPMARFVRDLLRLEAEVMAEMFDRETLQRMSGVPVDEAMLAMMREEKLRNTAIEVATDATIRPDQEQEKAEAIEFVQATTGFLQQAVVVSTQAPLLAPLMFEVFRQATQTFKFSRNIEAVIDQTVEAIIGQAQQQMAMQQQQMGAQPPNGAAPQQGMMQ